MIATASRAGWACAALCALALSPQAGSAAPADEPTSEREPAAVDRMVPMARLVGGGGGRRGDRSKAAHEAAVVVADVARPAPCRAAVGGAEVDCGADSAPHQGCSVKARHSPGVRWHILSPIRTPARIEATRAEQERVAGPLPGRGLHVVGTMPSDPKLRLPPHEALGLRAYAAMDLRRRWIEMRPTVIPADAVLRFSIGTEPVAWEIDTAPVSFIVDAREGDSRKPVELFRTSLDPSRNPEQRRWIDHQVPLARLAGKKVRLRFRTAPTDREDERPQLPVWGDPTIYAPERYTRPSIVLVSLDTLRARSLSALGRRIETSPFFDALASEGALFERAFTTYPNTRGSHMSMFTGLWPKNHRMHLQGGGLAKDKRTLAQDLRQAGYETAAFTENALLDGSAGFRRGFGRYAENKEVEMGAGASEATFAAALQWAKSHRDTPFFLFVHTYEVHAPYAPSGSYAELFADSEQAHHRSYEQEIRYLDDQLRTLVDGLDAILSPQNLLLVITADHGEEFYEHGFPYHTQLYDEVMHVPLLLRWPGVVPAGRRISIPVSLVDIPPTILSLAGVRPAQPPDGVSLRPLFADGGDIDRSVVFGEWFAPMDGKRRRHLVARSADHKCILIQGTETLDCYDLVEDPDERSPLPPGHDAATRAVRDAVVAYTPAEDEPAAPDGEPDRLQEIDPKREQKLRALGYVE